MTFRCLWSLINHTKWIYIVVEFYWSSLLVLIDIHFVSIPFQLLKDDIANHKALLQKAENDGQKLIASSKNNPTVVADVYGKLNKVRTALDSLAAKVDQRQNKLQNVLLQSQEFQVSFEDFLDKLAEVEEQIAKLQPVSGIHETAKDQTQEHKVIPGIIL